MGMGQDQTYAVVKAWLLDVDIARYLAVVSGSDKDHVALPAGENDPNFVGFSVIDGKAVPSGTTGPVVPIHMKGGIGLVQAAAAFSIGAALKIANAQGQVKAIVPTAPLEQLDPGLVPAANAATLLATAQALIGVNVTAAGNGKPLGAYGLLPKGVAPAVSGQCALSADGSKVNFLAGDGVTAVDIEYWKKLAPQYCIARALGAATQAGDLVPVIIDREVILGV